MSSKEYFYPVYIPIFLYSITASMFMPVTQSFLYAKVCESFIDSNGTRLNCSNTEASRNVSVHKEANRIMLFSSVALCVTAMLSSGIIGRVSDKKSRKMALLIPFIGLFLADITLLAQVSISQLSPYFFIFSEFLFGCFGGYMAIFSAAFAFLASFKISPDQRSRSISRMEGLIGLGGMVGYLISSQIRTITYFYGYVIFIIIHGFCIIFIIFMKDQKKIDDKPTQEKKDVLIPHGAMSTASKRLNIALIYTCFACSFFAFIGSAHILFFFLKSRFNWDAEQYSYLKLGVQGSSTFMALLVYPWLKSKNVKDSVLAVIGLSARALGKLWISFVPSANLMFTTLFFEMFARFPATALRSMLAANIENHKRGSAFAFIGTIEAFCNLTAALVFHSLFPWSLSFFPQLSFIIMASLIIPPTLLMIIFGRRFNQPSH